MRTFLTTNLFCLIHGDDPANNVFDVEATQNTTISKLREIIQSKQPHALGKIDTKDITLWKVNIPMSDLEDLNPNFDIQAGGSKLSPMADVQHYFTKVPHQHLHIIVEMSPMAGK